MFLTYVNIYICDSVLYTQALTQTHTMMSLATNVSIFPFSLQLKKNMKNKKKNKNKHLPYVMYYKWYSNTGYTVSPHIPTYIYRESNKRREKYEMDLMNRRRREKTIARHRVQW